MRTIAIDEIEAATLDDLRSIKEINSFLRLDIQDFYWDGIPYIASAIREGRCFVIRGDGLVKGCMIMEVRHPGQGYVEDSLAIGTLSVRPRFRNENLGVMFVGYARELARRENKRLYVESFYEFEKLAFYKALGFVESSPATYRSMPYHVLYVDP